MVAGSTVVVRHVKSEASLEELHVHTDLELGGHLRLQRRATLGGRGHEGIGSVHREIGSHRIVTVGVGLTIGNACQVRTGIVTGLTVCQAQLTETQYIVFRNQLRENPAQCSTGIEEAVVIDRQGGRPVVTGSQIQVDHIIPTDGHVTEETYQTALALRLGEHRFRGTVAQIPEAGMESQVICLTRHAGSIPFVHVHTHVHIQVQFLVQELAGIVGQEVVVQLVAATIAGIYITILVHVGGSIAIVLVNQRIIQFNLRITPLHVVVRIVETHTVGQCQILDRLDVQLHLTVNLLGCSVVVVVLQRPIGIGDAVRSEVSLRLVEGRAGIFHIDDGNVARHFIQTVDNGCSLIGTYRIGAGTCEVDRRGDLQPVGGIVRAAESNGVTFVLVVVARHDTVIARIRIRDVVRHLVVVGKSVQRNGVAL